jgi:hypothetical protein
MQHFKLAVLGFCFAGAGFISVQIIHVLRPMHAHAYALSGAAFAVAGAVLGVAAVVGSQRKP